MPPVNLSLSPRQRMFDPAGRLLQRPSFRTPPFLPEGEAAEAGMESYGVTAPDEASAPAAMPPPRLSPTEQPDLMPEVTPDEQREETYLRQLRDTSLTQPPPQRPKIGLGRKIAGIASSLIPLTRQFTSPLLEGDYPRQKAEYDAKLARGEKAMGALAGTARGREQEGEKRRQFETEQDVALAKEGIFEAGAGEPPQGAETHQLRGRTYAIRPKTQNLTPGQAQDQATIAELRAAGLSEMDINVALARAGQQPSMTPDEEIQRQVALEDATQKVRAKYKIQEGGIQDEQLQTTASALLSQAGGDPKRAVEMMNSPTLDPKIAPVVAKYRAPLTIYINRTSASESFRELMMRLLFPGAGGGTSTPEEPGTAPSLPSPRGRQNNPGFRPPPGEVPYYPGRE